MFRLVGQMLLLIATLALLPGASATHCAVAELFGVEIPHHTVVDSTDCDSHEHPHEEEPCSEDCSLDFGDLSLPQSLSAPLPASFVSVDWNSTEFRILTNAAVARDLIVPRPDRPPPVPSPVLTGSYLI